MIIKMADRENNLYSAVKKLIVFCSAAAFTCLFFALDQTFLLSVSALFVFLFFLPRLSRRSFVILLIVFSVAVRLLIVFLIKTPPISDFELQFRSARELISGDLSYLQKPYFQLWSYQVGLVLYEALLLKIVDSIYIIKVVNCLFSAATVLLVYLCARRILSENAARAASVVWSTLTFQTLYVTVLSNSVPCTFFTAAAVYFYLSLPKKSGAARCVFLILVGALTAAADFFWPGGILMILSFAACEITAFFRAPDRKNLMKRALNVGAVAISYVLLFQAVSLGTAALGFTEKGLVNSDPNWKFAVGTNVKSSGCYSNELVERLSEVQKTENVDRDTAEKIIIRQNLGEGFGDLLQLVLKKIKIFWADVSLDWSLYHLPSVSWLRQCLTSLASSQVMILIITAALGIAAFFSKRRENGHDLFLFYFLANFFCYLAIEVQPRYSYTSDISLVILGGFAFDYLYSKLPLIKLRLSDPAKNDLSGSS
ncbi:MAG: glycosyltransferase family 39 protein [Clostridia bacterium]|nr:glycosyltransferase family 39 protein [Clostridia bacterium]